MAWLTGSVVAFALVTAATLVWMTTALHDVTISSTDAVESVHLLDDAEIELFLIDRANDPAVIRDLESTLRSKLSRAQEYVGSDREARALEEATARVEAYLVARPNAPLDQLRDLQASAYGALEAVVALNLSQSRAQRTEAHQLDTAANVIGVVLAVLLVLTAIVMIVWLRHRAFRSVLQLADAMARFGQGKRDARAAEIGPAELREMSLRFNEMAEALVGERNAQLAVLGGVAHDLRQPLSALSMSTAMLDPEHMEPAELRRLIEISKRQIDRLERMVQDFLDTARFEVGELELRLAHEDLRKLVRGVLELHHGPALHERVVLQLPEQPMFARCDALRIEQVIANLVSNALKYSPPDQRVDVVVEPRDNWIAIRVVDRGVGISAADQARLFEPFRRFGAGKRAIPGIGLGLYVVRKIVEAHGGQVEVHSALGRGTEIVVLLPPNRVVAQPEAHS